MRVSKFLFAAVCCGAASITPALAQPAPAEAIAPITALNEGLIQAEKTGAKPFAERYAALAPVVDRAFNLSGILQTIVGLRWPQIPSDQQAKLLATFRTFTVANYVANFNNYGGDEIQVLPESRAVGADRVVETAIVPKDGGDHVRLDYLMRQGSAGWQAVDVLEMATISQTAVQRSDFRSLLQDGGAPKLIASLQQKIDAMSGGTIKP